MIPTIEENPKGLHQRFAIRKVIGKVETNFGHGYKLKTKKVDPDAEYFVLRLDMNGKDPNHIAACRKAIHAYAEVIKWTIPELAKDLLERYPLV